MLNDRRRHLAPSLKEVRASLTLSQRARLAELEREGWVLHCVRESPRQVVLCSPRKRLAVLGTDGQLADPMGVTVRSR